MTSMPLAGDHARPLPRLHRLIPFLYLVVALPLALLIGFLNPPFQAPDEPNHVLRAAHLARGGLVGLKVAPDNSGGVVPSALVGVVHGYYQLDGPVRPFDHGKLARARSIAWGASGWAYEPFTNTVIYPPFFYLPAMAGLRLGQVTRLSVVNSVQLARILTAAAAVLLATLALRLIDRGRALLLVVLSLPTTLYLFSAVTQDGLMVASAAVVAGLCARALQQARALSGVERGACALILGALWAARPPYVPLLGLLLLPTALGRSWSSIAALARAGAGLRLLAALWPFLVALAIGVAWIAFGAAPAKTPFRLGDGVSIAGQVHYLLTHPLAVISIARETTAHAAWHLWQAAGVFGWSQIYMPVAFYWGALAALLLAAFTMIGFGEAARAVERTDEALQPSSWSTSLTVGLALILSYLAIYVVQYLTWTPVGGAYVDGVQGRYLLPVAAFLPLAFWSLEVPFLDEDHPRLARGLLAVGAVTGLGILAATALYAPWLLWSSYG